MEKHIVKKVSKEHENRKASSEIISPHGVFFDAVSHKQHIKEFFQCSLSNRFMLKLFILQDIPAFSCVKTNVVDLCILVYFVSLKTISR